ncbi:alpha/beta hydrolase [Kineococcus sp. NBC_00420]|uniref:alpha/beta hydrolase n=1 Tax=Kineococcus sp. NBC_00420 TaxID=2903564 RepID=UPI002E21AB26
MAGPSSRGVRSATSHPTPGDPPDVELDPRLSDPQAARLVARRERETGRLVPRHVAGIAVARARARQDAPGPVEDAALVVRDVTVRGAAGPLPARTYLPRTGSRASVLYLHGGGWALGERDVDDSLCRAIATGAGVAVLSLGYRLAPEHPYPAALEDSATLLGALADGDVEGFGGPLVVAGLGAGGQLAAVLALRSRSGFVPPIVHQSLFCPVLDCDLDRPSHREFGAGLGLSLEDLAWFWRMYVPDRATRRRPDVSPLRIPDASGLAPATVVVAGADPLRDEAYEYAERLLAAGVDVRRVLVEGVPHGFVAVPGLVSAAGAVRAATDHLATTLDRRPPAGPRVVDLRDRAVTLPTTGVPAGGGLAAGR